MGTVTKAVLWFVAALVSVPSAQAGAVQEWLWVRGELEDATHQEEYLALATQIFDSYQERGMMPGRLVAERELESIPDENFVVLGPIQAFTHLDQFGLPLEVADSTVTIGGHRLSQPRTGIYLAEREQTSYAYLGLSLDGFRDVFTVPTGMRACTVTRARGRVRFEGDWGEEGLVLEGVPFLPRYPSEEELRDLELPADALRVQPVLTEPDLGALEPAFARWLDAFVDGQRVVFFGEGHWNQGVNLVFNAIVEHLLEAGDLRAIFLEVNYSFSGFYDYYVTEPDGERAQKFLETRLHPLVSSPDTLALLVILRSWNLDHPDRQVHVGCVDMEWNITGVARNILRPYFKRMGGTLPGDLGSETGRAQVRRLLDKAMEEGTVGEYPFLTPEYIDTVLVNLRDTVDIEDFNVDRQRGIIRNATEFNGRLLEDGLVIFKGGGWHAVKRKLAEESFYRDAAYLNEVHPPTKGKVVTLQAAALGYRFSDAANLDLAQTMPSATNYNNFLREFKEALAEGRAEVDACYLIDGNTLPLFDRLVAKAGYALRREIVHVQAVDWDALTKVHGQGVLGTRLRDYDAGIYVLRADIEIMRPRAF